MERLQIQIELRKTPLRNNVISVIIPILTFLLHFRILRSGSEPDFVNGKSYFSLIFNGLIFVGGYFLISVDVKKIILFKATKVSDILPLC